MYLGHCVTSMMKIYTKIFKCCYQFNCCWINMTTNICTYHPSIQVKLWCNMRNSTNWIKVSPFWSVITFRIKQTDGFQISKGREVFGKGGKDLIRTLERLASTLGKPANLSRKQSNNLHRWVDAITIY